jgi:murein endopeptidase
VPDPFWFGTPFGLTRKVPDPFWFGDLWVPGYRSPGMARALLAVLLVLAVVVPAAAGRPAQEQRTPPEPVATPDPVTTPAPAPVTTHPADADLAAIDWQPSRALGLPFRHGRLVDGVQLPEEGANYLTWDPPLKQVPNREWRRWGTDYLVASLLIVIAEHRAANPEAPRILIGDLSRPVGGSFGARFGGLGHASHQNGLDADVYYPRRDRRELRPSKPIQVDQVLAQDLVDRFVAIGADKVFVGPHLKLTGPKRVVSRLVYHDDHLHVRLYNPARVR